MEIPKLITKERTPAQWEKRRSGLLALLGTYEYGITPKISLDKITYTDGLDLMLEGGIRYESHRVFFKKGDWFCSMRFEVFSPKAARPMPSVLLIDMFDSSPDNIAHPELSAYTQARLPYTLLADRGYAAVLVHVNDICNDSVSGCRTGIMEVAPKAGASDWGAIGAWAWGASRVVDYLIQDERFDSQKITVSGVSRGGKTSLWCAAQDTRIGAVIATVSGCGGASLLRGKTGEHICHMTANFPYWTCDKFAEYAQSEEALPIDQHMLLALCAPRPLYLSDAIEDEWADPHKAFEAALLAGEAYRLLGKKGLCSETFPDVCQPLLDGDIAYHVRSGGHGILPYDWEQYLQFLDKYFQA